MRRTLFIIFIFLFLAACGEKPPEATPTPALTAQEALGSSVFSRECGACHSLAEDTVIVGPSMFGIASRADAQVGGQDAHTYILSSILKPDSYLVDGFENLMPSTFGKSLTGEEVDAIVAFLLTME